MRKYIKPEMEDYSMSPVSILEGSIKVKANKVGISSFFTDDEDWKTESNGTTRSYSFWE